MKLSKVYKAETYKEVQKKCPKGYRLPEIWELVKLACEKNKIIFETEKGNWIFFWSNKLDGDYYQRLNRLTDGDWDTGWYDIGDSYSDGRVVYIKEDLK